MARQPSRSRLRRRLLQGLALLLGGACIAAALTYAVGNAMAPYEGEHGFPGFLWRVFAAALQGQPGAVLLLLSPSLVVTGWWLLLGLLRRTSRGAKQET